MTEGKWKIQEGSHRLVDLIFKAIAGVGIATAFIFSLDQYSESKEREYKKPLWERQLETYFEVASIASTIANTSNNQIRAESVERFWTLYFGPVAMLEDAMVEDAMIQFGYCLDGTDSCSVDEMIHRSLVLSHALRESIGRSWGSGLSALKGKYKNQPPDSLMSN